MSVVGGVDFTQRGWTYLPYRFEADELKALSNLGLHTGRGQRLTDMSALTSTFSSSFSEALSKFGFSPEPLRAVGFNKSAETNWSLPWHQDRVVAMPRQIDNPEFKNWSRKSGVWHCEPPVEILEQIAFAYIAFDNIHDRMGGLELAEGTHRVGAIPESEIDRHIQAATIARPDMVIGQVLLISALTLHRSAPQTLSRNRRTLRIDFGPPALNLSK